MWRKICQFIATMLVLAGPARGGPLPRMVHFVRSHREEIAADTLGALAVGSDYGSTRYALRSCASCYEENSLLGRHPGNLTLGLFLFGQAGGMAFANHEALKHERGVWRHDIWVWEGWKATDEVFTVYHNVQMADTNSFTLKRKVRP